MAVRYGKKHQATVWGEFLTCPPPLHTKKSLLKDINSTTALHIKQKLADWDEHAHAHSVHIQRSTGIVVLSPGYIYSKKIIHADKRPFRERANKYCWKWAKNTHKHELRVCVPEHTNMFTEMLLAFYVKKILASYVQTESPTTALKSLQHPVTWS